MKLSGRGAPYVAIAISILALLVATTSASYAVVKLAKNSVGTAQLKKGAVTSKKVKDGTLQARDFRAGVLRTGPQGLPGVDGVDGVDGIQGPPGLPGAPAVSYWAVVQSDGTLVRSSADTAVSTTVIDLGVFVVDFGTDITGCSFTGAIATPSTTPQPAGVLTLAVRNGNVEGVYVETMNLAGTLTAKGFHVQVAC